jgi:proline dehydrogenase
LALFDRAIVRMLPAVPRPLVQRLSERYIAGPELKDAREAVRHINAQGKLATIDVLGEEITNEHEAAAIVRAYQDVFADIEHCGLDSNVSVKLTALGLNLDYDLCRANLGVVVADAASRGNFVRIDMEDHTTTDATLAMWRAVRPINAGHGDSGVVIQAALRRSPTDVDALIAEQARIRLCKGAYVEPAAVAFPDKADVDAAYGQLMERLLREGSFPAIATHDERLIARAVAFVRANGIEPDRFEFQMLYGIRRDLQERLVRAGYGVRVYVPFGTQWYPYFMRRLAERPANVAFILRSILREGRDRPAPPPA